MEPDMKTFTITMPAVGLFLFGTAVCCFCCFKYGLQRWYERTLEKTRTNSRTGITYAASLQHKKEQLEHALRKVTKLRKAEPTRSDLKYEAVALKEGIRMLHEHLRNSERYSDYCEAQKRPPTPDSMHRLTMDGEHGSSFVNPMFTAHQPNVNMGKASEAASPASSDEECHNPKHRELELYLMSTGGAILPSMLAYPGGSSPPPPPRLAGASRRASPLGQRELATDGEGRFMSASPAPDSPPPPPPPRGMPPNRQQMSPTVNQSFGSNPRLEV